MSQGAKISMYHPPTPRGATPLNTIQTALIWSLELTNIEEIWNTILKNH